MAVKTVIREIVNRSNDWIMVQRLRYPEEGVYVDVAPGAKANFNASIPRNEYVTEDLINQSIGVSKGDPRSSWRLYYVVWQYPSYNGDNIYKADSGYMPPALYQLLARAGGDMSLVINDVESGDIALERVDANLALAARTAGWTHHVTIDTQYYLDGPEQARPPDGVLVAGTKVMLIEEAGSYCLVRSQEGIEAYVRTSSLEPRPTRKTAK